VRSRSTRPSRPRQSTRPAARPSVPPVLVRQIRNGIVESEHRGHIVEVDAGGSIVRVLGDPERVVSLRSAAKPFGLIALIEAGGIEAFDLAAAELALMTGSHSGEDMHVRTLQGVFRRSGVSQSQLACGSAGAPLDALTAARLARDGEKPGPLRHMCSGAHAASLLLSRMRDWPAENYWMPEHPSQAAYRSAVARAFGTKADRLVTAIDGCGIETFAFPLREIARAFAFLADPSALAGTDPRSGVAQSLLIVRDAMLAHPEMVGGSRERLDTSLMKALPERLVSKGGSEALRGVAILPGGRANGGSTGPSGMAIKIDDGDGHNRAGWAAGVEALQQAGVLEGQALRSLGRYHQPTSLDPHGRLAGETIAKFELAPVGELFG
jgi:L-asparaginase II